MSIQHLEDAAESPLHATTKLVFMALADDANKLTRITFPGRPKLCLWAGVSDRRAQQIIEELIIRGYLARRAFGMPGRNAEFLIFPTDEELEALDEKDPALNAVSQDVLERVKRADAAVARKHDATAKKAAERAEARIALSNRTPVDNSDAGANTVTPECTHEINNGCTSVAKGCNPECTPPVSTPLKDLNKSSKSTQVTGAVDNSKSDDASNHIPPTPKPAGRRNRKQLDTAALAASVGEILADIKITDDGIRELANRIIGRAAATVVDPTAYVAQAIRRHPREWRAVAADIAVRASLGPVIGNGNNF